MSHVHVIHKNPEWSEPLFSALRDVGASYVDWNLAEPRHFDMDRPPAPGIYYNRMSASSHSRGNRYASEFTHALLSWLEHHGATVINPLSAMRLEVSKVEQYAALKAAGVTVPRTIVVHGDGTLVEAARSFDGAFITKHNRAGKGLGVRLFQSADDLASYLKSGKVDPPVDGIWLLQDYISSPEKVITRVEFIGRQFYYAVRVDTSGGFELCPADGGLSPIHDGRPPFEVISGFSHPIIERFQRVMHERRIDVAGFEFIEDADGKAYAYDINTNTNYNRPAELADGSVSAIDRLAGYLASRLEWTRAA